MVNDSSVNPETTKPVKQKLLRGVHYTNKQVTSITLGATPGRGLTSMYLSCVFNMFRITCLIITRVSRLCVLLHTICSYFHCLHHTMYHIPTSYVILFKMFYSVNAMYMLVHDVRNYMHS